MVGPSSTCSAPASSTPTEQFQLDRKTSSTECNLSASTPRKSHVSTGVDTAGGTIDPTVCLTDVMATCATITRIELPKDSAEVSVRLLPVLLGKDGGRPIREYHL